MAKVTANVFGDTQIRKALQYASAIQSIGGVSKLTAQQQAQVNTVVTQAIAKYQALGQQAPAALHAIAAATQQVQDQGQNAFGSLFQTIAGGVTVGNLLASGIRNALSSIVSGIQSTVVGIGKAFAYLVDRGADVDQIRQAFVKLAHDAGQVPEKLLAAGRIGVRGLVTDYDLMKSANQAMLFGLQMNEKEFGTLTRAAQTLGRAMGQDATKSLNDLIVALGRTSPRILDNLGIIVKVGEANNKYADSIGKTVKQLTAEERQNAFYVESMRKIEEKIKSIGEVHLTLRDRLTQVGVSAKNFTDALAVAVSISPVLNAGFDNIAKAVMNAFGVNQVQTVQKLMSFIDRLAIAVVQAGQVITTGFIAILALISPMIQENFKAVETLTLVVNKLARTLRTAFSFIPLLTPEFADVSKKIRLQLEDVETASWNISAASKEGGVNFKNMAVEVGIATANIQGLLADTEKKMKAQLGVRVKDSEIIQEIIKLNKKREDQEDKLSDKELKALEKKKKKLAEIMTFGDQFLKQDFMEKFFSQTSSEGKILYRQLTEDYNWVTAWNKGLLKLTSNINDIPAMLKGINWTDMFKGNGTNPDPVKKKTDEFGDSLQNLTRMFSQLKTVSGDTWGGMTKDIAEALQLMEIGNAAGKSFREQFYNPKKYNTGEFDKQGNPIYKGGWAPVGFQKEGGGYSAASIAGGAANTAMAAYQGYGALMEATSSSSRGKNIGKGALTGASIGNSIVPGYGALVGAAVGAIVGALRGKALRDEIKIIGKEWGLDLGDEMAKQIVQVSKEKFKGDRRTGELFLMDQIIAQGGGISDKNRKLLEAQLGEVVQAFLDGKMDANQAKEVLEKNFGAFADYYTKTGKVISKEMRQIIAQTAEFKVQSESIKEFVKTNVDALSASIVGFLTPAVKQFEGFSERLNTAQNELIAAQQNVDALKDKEGGAGIEDTREADKALALAKVKMAELNELQARGAEAAKVSWETAALAALKGFNGAQAQGLSYIDSFDKMSDALTVLKGLQKDLGITTDNEAITSLLHEQELSEAYADRVQQAKSLNETAVALGNLNALDVEMLARMQVQGKSTYESLTDAGFTQEQSLRRILPYLETIIQGSKDQGVAVDETTQGYIKQATEMGLFGEKAKTTNELLAQGFGDFKAGIGALITTLGGELPKAWSDAANASVEAGKVMSGAVTDLDRKVSTIPDRFYTLGRSAKGAADEAVDALGRVGRAAQDAQYDVDGVSQGHSPGGFKDIKPFAEQAAKATMKWRDTSVSSAREVQGAIDQVNMAAMTGALIGPEASRPITLQEEYHLSFTPNVIDGTDLQDMVENDIAPFVITAIEKNRQGALTRARRALGM